MFNDKRSKKIVVVAHCLLNQNSISDGTADLPSQFNKIVNLLIENEIGIIQLPCPELLCLGLARKDETGANNELPYENTRIRTLMEKDENKELLRSRAREIVKQLEDYIKYDFQILGILGVNRSPSCGIETTTIDCKETEGRGVFMQILEDELLKQGIKITMVGTKTGEQEESYTKVKNIFEK